MLRQTSYHWVSEDSSAIIAKVEKGRTQPQVQSFEEEEGKLNLSWIGCQQHWLSTKIIKIGIKHEATKCVKDIPQYCLVESSLVKHCMGFRILNRPGKIFHKHSWQLRLRLHTVSSKEVKMVPCGSYITPRTGKGGFSFCRKLRGYAADKWLSLRVGWWCEMWFTKSDKRLMIQASK